MKSTEKDVLMICKGHYDHKKYKTIKDALDTYYRKHYRVSSEVVPELSYSLILKSLLEECVKTFVTQETISTFLYDVLCEKLVQENNNTTEYYEVLYHRIVNWISSLKVMNKHNDWIIDLSDYRDEECII